MATAAHCSAQGRRNVDAAARDGDVIIAHINQPTHAAGAGVAAGILALKTRGFEFVLLRDGAAPADPALHSSLVRK